MTRSKRQLEEIIFKASGVFLSRPGTPNKRIAAPIRVRATVSVEGMPNKLVAMDFFDYDRRVVSLKLPRADFLDYYKFRHALENAGYQFPHDVALSKRLHLSIVSLPPKERWKIVHRVGWHGDHFVRPNSLVRTNGQILRFESETLAHYAMYECRGTLTEWKERVARHALCSSRLIFSISLALAAPLIRFSDVESGGFHLFGESTKGKTTCLLAATSVARPGIRNELLNWDITDPALEEVAAGHNDSLLCLDEVGQLRTDASTSVTKKLRTTAFKLAGGRGRLRSSLWGQKLGARELRWRLFFLSTGEHALSELASQAETQRLKGEEARLIDVPAIVDPTFGIYERLPPGFSTVDEALLGIAEACIANCGMAIEAFLGKVCIHLSKIEDVVQRRMAMFMKVAKIPSDAWEQRFARRFALAFAAGTIAAEFGIVPWDMKSIGVAIKACYLAARAAVPDAEKTIANGFARLRTQLSGAAKILELIRSGHKLQWTHEAAQAAEAFRDAGPAGQCFLVRSKTLVGWMASPLQADLVVDELDRKNYLMKDPPDVRTIQKAISGIPGRPRYYAIRETFLTA